MSPQDLTKPLKLRGPTTQTRPIAHTPLRDIHDLSELPESLYFGRLCPETFKRDATGQEVEYREGDFWQTLRWNDVVASIEQFYCGELISSLMFTSKWTLEQSLRLQFVFSEGAESRFKADLEERFEICCLGVDRQRLAGNVYFPDGFFGAIVIPVPLRPTLVASFIRALETACFPGETGGGFGGFMRLIPHGAFCKIDAIEGIPFEDEEDFRKWNIRQGYIPLGAVVHLNNGDLKALGLTRVCPHFVWFGPIRVIPHILQHFKSHHVFCPGAIAGERGFVMPDFLLTQPSKIQVFDPNRTRSVNYSGFNVQTEVLKDLVERPPATIADLADYMESLKE